MPELSEAQLYDLCSGGRSGLDPKLFNYLYIHHLRHEHNMPLHLISKRMGLKMKEVQKYLDMKLDKDGRLA